VDGRAFAQMFGDVELVMHDRCLRHGCLGRGHIKAGHVYGHRLDLRELLFLERGKEKLRRLLVAPFHDFEHPAALQIG